MQKFGQQNSVTVKTIKINEKTWRLSKQEVSIIKEFLDLDPGKLLCLKRKYNVAMELSRKGILRSHQFATFSLVEDYRYPLTQEINFDF